ncbi:unnamed protein product, partial [Owenia fusiformis]
DTNNLNTFPNTEATVLLHDYKKSSIRLYDGEVVRDKSNFRHHGVAIGDSITDYQLSVPIQWTNAYTVLSNYTILNRLTSDPFTIETWIFTNNTLRRGWMFEIPGSLEFLYFDGGSNRVNIYTTEGVVGFDMPYRLSNVNNALQYFAITFDGRTLRGFINGLERNRTILTGSPILATSDSHIYIGRPTLTNDALSPVSLRITRRALHQTLI